MNQEDVSTKKQRRNPAQPKGTHLILQKEKDTIDVSNQRMRPHRTLETEGRKHHSMRILWLGKEFRKSCVGGEHASSLIGDDRVQTQQLTA